MQPQQQWKGLKPNRFEVGRKHIRPQGQLDAHMQPVLSTFGSVGIRTFTHTLKGSEQQIYKPLQKIYSHAYQRTQNQVDLRGKKYIELPQQRFRARPERNHIEGGQQTFNQFQNRGIKSFGGSTAVTQTQYALESKLQRKTRIATYQQQRNGVGTSALGDKPYKYPEYSSKFYKDGGLIPGSTFRPQLQKQIEQQKNKKIPVFTKPNWNVKVLLDEAAEQKKAVNSVDEWQQTILKQANPNWNDPDTFFERMEAKKDPKDQKKAGKK